MAIKLELGNLYGMDSIDDLMRTIENLRSIGMSDDDINKILERSRDNGTEKEKGSGRGFSDNRT